MQPGMSATFWKSPYSGLPGGFTQAVTGSTTFSNGRHGAFRESYLRSDLEVIRSKLNTRLPPADIKPVRVRSILKHVDVDGNSPSDDPGGEAQLTARSARSELAPKSASGKLHLITTGTGKGEPYGSKPRAKSSNKRVKFGGLPSTHTYLADKFGSLPTGSSRVTSARSAHRGNNPRLLGSNLGLHASVLGSSESNGPSANGTNGGIEIKHQIQDFVRRLRQAELERASKRVSVDNSISNIDNRSRTAEKLRQRQVQTRPKTFGKTFFDWAEFDIEQSEMKNRIQLNELEQELQASEDGKEGNNNERDSGSCQTGDSLESFTTQPEDEQDTIVEETKGGAKIIRPRPNASLYTKYRHITSNVVNKYDCKPPNSRYSLLQSNIPDYGVNNYCDKSKASQIMTWLQDVNNAQSESK